MTDVPAIGPIVETLRAYVGSHPRVVDSARGIREWWLADLPGPHHPSAVDAAIEQLAAEGLLEPFVLPDGVTVWRAHHKDD